MSYQKIFQKLDFNAPVILGMSLLALAVLILNTLTLGASNRFLAVYYTSWLDPLMYVRLFTHVLTHQNWAHYAGNFMLILAVGPMVEEKYGSRRLCLMILLTALVTGLVNIIFFQRIMLMGASGIVFMLILLASFVNIRNGKIPLTVILVGVLYLGSEATQGLFGNDNISQLSHILGGLCGAGFGFYVHGQKIGKKRRPAK